MYLFFDPQPHVVAEFQGLTGQVVVPGGGLTADGLPPAWVRRRLQEARDALASWCGSRAPLVSGVDIFFWEEHLEESLELCGSAFSTCPKRGLNPGGLSFGEVNHA